MLDALLTIFWKTNLSPPAALIKSRSSPSLSSCSALFCFIWALMNGVGLLECVPMNTKTADIEGWTCTGMATSMQTQRRL